MFGAARSERTRVVVVEDDPVLLRLLDDLLTAEGYQVFLHTRAADAHVVVRHGLLERRRAQPSVVHVA
jgi:DNA-binding response OmpR family regulator